MMALTKIKEANDCFDYFSIGLAGREPLRSGVEGFANDCWDEFWRAMSGSARLPDG
jgi:hypothetical protein